MANVNMTKMIKTAQVLNWMLLLLLIASVLGFFTFKNVYGFFLASVTALIALGIYKNNKFAYFSAAAWGLAAYQLAKEGYEFQVIKSEVMLIGVLVIPVALFLHEVLGKNNKKSAQKSVKDESESDNMPQ